MCLLRWELINQAPEIFPIHRVRIGCLPCQVSAGD
jgi:hypothetical protein